MTVNQTMQPLLKVENLVKLHAGGRISRSKQKLAALDGVSLAVAPQSTLVLVGESGSGKSTLALCIACLERPTSGTIVFEGMDITALPATQLREVRPQIQLVFQDPAASLNPRWTALEIISEPLLIQRRFTKAVRENRVLALLDRVALPRKLAGRRADELSGGQKQRLAIARALALEPKLIILDEALSALDCSVQAQISNLLLDLQSSLGLAYIFITHDFAMAAHLADEIGVMDRGRIVESGPAEKVLLSPSHEATRSLIAATPALAQTQNALVEI
ncbi:MAG TPA: ATP-binding cassette domain-containing protein [Candidatus Solibacter sp.]|nr:ATP-binding cassette domain-containing protein [Candidatus Solibacter sp.]